MKRSIRYFLVVFHISVVMHAQQRIEIALEPEHQKLVIKNFPGSITLVQGPSEEVRIEFVPPGLSAMQRDKVNRETGMDASQVIGLEIRKLANLVYVDGASSQIGNYRFEIPQGISVELEDSTWDGKGGKENNWQNEGLIEVHNFDAEVNIKSKFKPVKVSDCTGPLLINTVTGQVVIDNRSLRMSPPTSVITINGNLEIVLSRTTRPNLLIKSLEGEVEADPSLPLTDETQIRGSSRMGWQYYAFRNEDSPHLLYLESTYGNINIKVK